MRGTSEKLLPRTVSRPLTRRLASVIVALVGLGAPGSAAAGPEPCPDCWRPPQTSSWQLQLRGELSLPPKLQVYDVDGLSTPASVVSSLHSGGARAICYLNAGVWESWRSDAGLFPRSLLGRGTGHAGERWLNIRRLRLLRPRVQARLEKCARKGFDAVDADNVDGYRHLTGFALSGRDQLRYNRWLANAAHRVGLAIALRNDRGQAAALLPYFDFAISENCFGRRDCNPLNRFVAAGKAVYEIEYTLPRSAFCGDARSRGFSAMKKRASLGAYRRPCPPSARILSAPTSPTNKAATFTFAVSADAARAECSLDGTLYEVCSTPATFSGLADGSHTLRVRALDGAGYAGRAAAHSWTLDTVAPDALITGGPPDPASDLRATFSFSSNEADAQFECRIDAAAYTRCSSPQTILVDSAGVHTYVVRALDAAGNAGRPASFTWTVADAGRIRPWTMQFVGGGGTATVSKEQALRDARHFDLLMAHAPVYQPYVSAMKSENPRLQLFAYMNSTFTYRTDLPESAYSHDAEGNRIYPYEWPSTFLLDPTSPIALDFQERRASLVMRQSGYDGLFADVTGLAPLSLSYVNALPINPSTGEVWTPTEWLEAVGVVIDRIRAVIGARPIITNGLKSGPAYYGATPLPGEIIFGPGIVGSVAESWLRHPSDPISAYPSETRWKQNVDMLIDVGSHAGSVLAMTKTWANGTIEQKDAWYRFAIASWLMGNDGRAYFHFTADKGDTLLDRPLNHLDLGPAVGPYTKLDGVYQRFFTGGRVFVNPTTTSQTIPLGDGYRTLSGTPITSITLGPNSAEILVR
jgi:hypothetical protein